MSKSLTAKQYCLLAWPWIASSAGSIIAYSIRDVSFSYRWLIGFGVAKSCQYIQIVASEEWKKILPSLLSDPKKASYWLFINGIFSFTLSNGMIGFFGGNKFYKKHGIDSYKKAIISSLTNGQVYFRKNKNATYKALKQLLKVCGSIGIGYGICKYLKCNPLIVEKIKNNKILHIELLGLLVSIQVFIPSVVANIHYLIFSMIDDDIEVIQPFDFAFFSSSIRSFWKNWSRPVGELLRYVVYEPLGGRQRFWLSVPAVFAMNCSIHYDFSLNCYGYRAISDWNKAFGIMGASISLQILTENIFLLKQKNNDQDVDDDINDIEDSLYWKVWCFGLFNVSMAATLFVIKEKAMISNIENACNTLCPL